MEGQLQLLSSAGDALHASQHPCAAPRIVRERQLLLFGNVSLPKCPRVPPQGSRIANSTGIPWAGSVRPWLRVSLKELTSRLLLPDPEVFLDQSPSDLLDRQCLELLDPFMFPVARNYYKLSSLIFGPFCPL